jgi:copper chaperone CopZ
MTRFLLPLGAALLVGAGAGLAACGSECGAPSGPPSATARPAPDEEVVYLETKGVTGTETEAVAKAVGAVEGVRTFAWAPGGARVVRQRGKAADEALLAAAKGAGADEAAKVSVATASFSFEKPLHCAGCVKEVKKAVTALPGVMEIEVPESRKDLVVVYDPRALKAAEVEAALAAIKKPAKAAPAP